MLPRFLHRLYAKLLGYFWLPCPLCGKMTGGHEWRHPGRVITYAVNRYDVSEPVAFSYYTESQVGYCNDHPPGSHGPLLIDPEHPTQGGPCTPSS